MMISKIISHYKILEKIGEGGMGIVYKAEDTKLKRTVALKFLPTELTRDEQAKKRFILEAQAASALDHSNICTIYEVDETPDGQSFIAMAYYEGKTLREKLEKGKLSVDDSLNNAVQVALGLAKAHEKGIIHRDIKPANIMITDEGNVKILDFGLAKLAEKTLHTKTGTTLGTVEYMSPEQAQGMSVDNRSDIWSLGVIIYEMLTGAKPFKGEFDQAVMYSIVNNEPEPIQKHFPAISPELLHIVNRTLEKHPKNRYQSMQEMLIDLQRVKRDSDKSFVKSNRITAVDTGLEKDNSKKTSLKRFIISIAILSVVIISSIIFLQHFLSTKKSSLPMKSTRLTSYPGTERNPVFSPDGNRIAFLWNGKSGDNYDIYTKQIGVGEYTALPITAHEKNEWSPTWTPDGKYIIFGRNETILPSNLNGLWGNSEIYRIPAFGGQEIKLTSGSQPDCSPNGDLIVLSDRDSTEAGWVNRIYLFSLKNNQRTQLTNPPPRHTDSSPKISPDGKKVAFLRSNLYPRWNNPRDMFIIPITGGKEVQITFDSTLIGGLAWTPDSKEIVFSSNRGGIRTLWLISENGGEPKSVSATGTYINEISISPDGSKLAYCYYFAEKNIVRYDISQSEDQNQPPERFMYAGMEDYSPSYSPDGQKIVFASFRSGNLEIWVCDKDGKNPFQVTHLSPAYGRKPQWKPDNKTIIFDSSGDICTIYSDGSNFKRLTNVAAEDQQASFSRDGNWIYFRSNRSGSYNIWKIPASGGEAVQITKDGGMRPVESPDGVWLYFSKMINNRVSIIKMPVNGGPETIVLQYIDMSSFPHKGSGNSDWMPFNDGIYFQEYDESGQWILKFYEFENKTTKTIIYLHDMYGGINISPDRRYLLTVYGVEESNVIMVENWR